MCCLYFGHTLTESMIAKHTSDQYKRSSKLREASRLICDDEPQLSGILNADSLCKLGYLVWPWAKEARVIARPSLLEICSFGSVHGSDLDLQPHSVVRQHQSQGCKRPINLREIGSS